MPVLGTTFFTALWFFGVVSPSIGEQLRKVSGGPISMATVTSLCLVVEISLAVRKAGKTQWNKNGTLKDIPLIIRKYAYVPTSQGRNEKQIYVRTQWACRSETALVKTLQPSQQSLPNSAESTHFNKGSHLKLKAT